MPNKGEWSEPYAAIKILGDQKLYMADKEGGINESEWMDVLELIRHETKERTVTYQYSVNGENIDVAISINGVEVFPVIPIAYFRKMAQKLSKEIRVGKNSSFDVSQDIMEFLEKAEIRHIKAASVNKSDLFLSVHDPRAGVVREHIGFSIKSEFGQNPTLFNTAKSSAFIYKLSGMTDAEMDYVNSLFDSQGHAAVSERCAYLMDNSKNPVFCGLPVAARAGIEAFAENLDLIDSRLVYVLERMLWNHFFMKESIVDCAPLIDQIVKQNPCMISRPEVKYPYMFKSFLYAAYCGMTASTLWDGTPQVNGGFIKVSASGEVVAHYALESDSFKSYLFDNCYLEFPSTDEKHGNYGRVYKEGEEYFFRLNFQIRYR